jgi:chromosome segregation ATPase
MEERLEQRVTELLEARETRAELRARMEALQADCERLSELVERLETDAAEASVLRELSADLKRRQEQGTAELARARAETESARRERDRAAEAGAQLAKQLETIKAQLAKVRAAPEASSPQPPGHMHDLHLKLQRAASDRDAAMALARQRELDMGEAQSRLNDLLASRWRKIGQRLGVAMTLPWEQTSNGRN